VESLERAIAAEAENKRLIEAIRKLPETSLPTVGQVENNKLRAEIKVLLKVLEGVLDGSVNSMDIHEAMMGVNGFTLTYCIR